MKKTFYSNGKLLITGEYVVLDGAKALALPTKKGQYLTVEDSVNKEIHWKSYDSDGSIWFETSISFLSVVNKVFFTENDIKNTLIEILHEAYLLNPSYLDNSNGYNIETKLTFPRFWGLGTSSTLINNIAQWLDIDAFVLLKNSFGGSGYDIACAQNDSAIIYQIVDGKPIVENIPFDPNFKAQIYFVYLNQKQSSKAAIKFYKKKEINLEKVIVLINHITQTVTTTEDIAVFINSLEKHEETLSEILETNTVKEKLFPNFNGTIKSLGAWGGDFVMAVTKENPKQYFKNLGFDIIASYEEMIL